MNSKTLRTTPKQELASVLLGEDVMTWMDRAHRDGSTWRDIAGELSYRTNGAVSVTEQTIHNWRKTRAGARASALAGRQPPSSVTVMGGATAGARETQSARVTPMSDSPPAWRGRTPPMKKGRPQPHVAAGPGVRGELLIDERNATR